MSEKDVAILEALLLELIEVMNEKPAIAKRLIEAIEHRFVNIPLDPITVYAREGLDGLRRRLERQSVSNLRILIRQYRIPCRNISKRAKGDIVRIISEYAANTDIRRGSEADGALASN